MGTLRHQSVSQRSMNFSSPPSPSIQVHASLEISEGGKNGERRLCWNWGYDVELKRKKLKSVLSHLLGDPILGRRPEESNSFRCHHSRQLYVSKTQNKQQRNVTLVSLASRFLQTFLRETGHQSILELVDAAIPAKQLEPIRQTIEMDCDSINTESDNISEEIKNVESTVSDIFSSYFSKTITIKRVTPHLLHNKIFLQIEVSMPPTMTIQ